MKNKKYIIIGFILLIAASIGGYFYFKKDSAALIEVQTVTVSNGSVVTSVTATGTIEPITQVEVGTQVSGVVEKVYVDYNSEVKAGQLIAELDKTNLRAKKAQAQAAYDNAVIQRNYLQTVYDRQKTLYDNQVISRADFDDASYNLNTATNTVAQRLSDLQETVTNLGYANIYSPIDGVVLSRDIDEGQTVAASYSTPTLFTIAQDLSEMQVEADVDEADIGEVKEGQRVSFTVDAYQDLTFNGEITQVRLDPTVTSNVVTYTVVIKAENPDLKLKPGLTATISIYTLELNDVLTTEAKAINFKPNMPLIDEYYAQQGLVMEKPSGEMNDRQPPGENESIVWTYGNDGSIKPTKVVLGASDGINVQIESGLEAGTQLVYNLKTESKVVAKTGGEATSPFMPKPPGRK